MSSFAFVTVCAVIMPFINDGDVSVAGSGGSRQPGLERPGLVPTSTGARCSTCSGSLNLLHV